MSAVPVIAQALTAYLHPGQLLVAARPTVVTTVLGSCVAVCLFDAVTGTGGINHFLLPAPAGPDTARLRFAPGACAALHEKLIALGAWPQGLRAKLFGGAGVLGAASGEIPLGARNVEAARAWLKAQGIPLLVEDVGGAAGRKLVFDTGSGAAWVRMLGGAGR